MDHARVINRRTPATVHMVYVDKDKLEGHVQKLRGTVYRYKILVQHDQTTGIQCTPYNYSGFRKSSEVQRAVMIRVLACSMICASALL